MASSAKELKQIRKELQSANKQTFDFNSAEALKARNWEERMSNTSHQRETKDLIAAGLNPVLSANSGANSYTTSEASAKAENAASEIASMYTAKLSADAQINSSKMNLKAAKVAASAQKYSADRSASATLASSMNSASAARDVANINKQASKYSAKKHYAGTKYSTDYSKSGSPAGIADKWLQRFVNFASKSRRSLPVSKNKSKHK